MFVIIFLNYALFPKKDNAILANAVSNGQEIIFNSSGNNGLLIDKKCLPTHPNETVSVDDKYDWCSNIAKKGGEKPFISYSIKNKAMKLKGYAVRNGCCHHCCCFKVENEKINYYCCCKLYSYSLLGSNDGKKWRTIHKIEGDENFYDCSFKTFDFPITESFAYAKFQQDEAFPKCLYCMQINQIELYGELVDQQSLMTNEDEGDESVSIIGKVRKHED